MKTNKEILDFFGVEIGKKYVVTKDYYTFQTGDTFEIEKDCYGFLWIKHHGGMKGLYLLFSLVYEEIKSEILDAKEKEYLGAVIKPFRSRVEFVSKRIFAFSTQEFIRIYLYDKDYCLLPCFKSNEMYKGMEAEKRYTLEELGL